MKRVFIVIFVAALVIVGLPLFASGKTEVKPTSTATTDGPQYGGTFTIFARANQLAEPPNPDIMAGQYNAFIYLDPIQETLLYGDVHKGPRGTGEHKFQVHFYIPDEFLKGRLLDRWEVTHEKIVLYPKKGVHWAADNVDFMENREITAEDIAADIIRFWESPWKTRFIGTIAAVNVVNDSVVIDFENYSNVLLYAIGYEDRAKYAPPEMVKAGPDKWKNQVGTGPFMFEEYVAGSHMSYKKNPNFWDKTTIDGKEYQLPFIDRLVYPIIPDESTQFAALKTGKLDFHRYVPQGQWDVLDRLAKDMVRVEYMPGTYVGIHMRVDEPPFDNLKVRQAMWLGTNPAEFRKMAMAEKSPVHSFPVNPNDVKVDTPLEKLPADIQEFYGYDPEKAKKMLADAGYPNGFETEYHCSTEPILLDFAALLKYQWEKIGVTLNIKALDPVAAAAIKYPIPVPKYHGTTSGGGPVSNPLLFFDTQFKSKAGGNFSVWSDPVFDDMLSRANLSIDAAERNKLVKDMALRILNAVTEIPTHSTVARMYYWPWVKNYYGEFTTTDDGTFASLIQYMWIDRGLKAEMGFK